MATITFYPMSARAYLWTAQQVADEKGVIAQSKNVTTETSRWPAKRSRIGEANFAGFASAKMVWCEATPAHRGSPERPLCRRWRRIAAPSAQSAPNWGAEAALRRNP